MIVCKSKWVIVLQFLILLFAPVHAQTTASVGEGNDITSQWHIPRTNFDYTLREILIPLRDGVRLHTLIAVPKEGNGRPILLERTPYDASTFLDSNVPRMRDAVTTKNREWVDDGYILVFQDVRGKFASEGQYLMTRPPIGPLNNTTTDETTDAYDTIDWLSKNVSESNGRVGMIGSSYNGWAVSMALIKPNPAMKVAASESPMTDGWMGDDWFHYGVFRQMGLDYIAKQTGQKGKGHALPSLIADDYEKYLKVGSAGAYARAMGFDALPWWNRLSAHPNYDQFWQQQAVDRLLSSNPSKVPTIWLQGLWDQEDMYGAIHSWEALRAKGATSNNYLVMGPWYHSQVNYSGNQLGPLHWHGDTSMEFRKQYLIPFFDKYLKDEKPREELPRALIYNPAANVWQRFDDWPPVHRNELTPLFLQSNGELSFEEKSVGADNYVSDPAKPVPYEPVPISFADKERWRTWLVQDQRFVSNRPDVLNYETVPLEQDITVQGAPFADMFLSTTGSDLDVVIKIIDVYPATDPDHQEMAGYQLPISLDIFRGRYRHGLSTPQPAIPGVVDEYSFRLPTVNWIFKKGHKIMVQVQSSLFPLYDRNPQSYIPNIFFAQPGDYHSSIISVNHSLKYKSSVLLPIIKVKSDPR